MHAFLSKIVWFSGCLLCLLGSAKAQESKHFKWKTKSLNFLGAEVGKINLRNNYEPRGYWTGHSIDLGGMATFGYLKGQASYQDSARTIHMNGSHWYGGTQFSYSLLKNHFFDIYPLWGVGVQFNRMQNGRTYYGQDEDRRFETNGLGGYLSVGLGVVVGPISVKAKLTGIATANFNRANAIKPFQYYPSLTLGIKPFKMLMNPYLFTAHGVHYRQEVKDKKVTQSYGGPGYDILTYSYTVKTTYQEGSATVMDVRPYWFIGPSYSGALSPDEVEAKRVLGVSAGFRFGTLYLDGNYASGAFGFRDPLKRDGFTEPTEADFAAPRLDGYFASSSRYGGRIGADLVTWGVKSRFIPYGNADARRLKQATSYFALIPTFGMGKITLGKAVFNDPKGEQYFREQMQEKSNLSGFITTTQRRMSYLSGGIMVMLGTATLEYNVYFAKKEGSYSALNKEIGLAWKLPVFRLFRIGKVMRLERQKAKNESPQ